MSVFVSRLLLILPFAPVFLLAVHPVQAQALLSQSSQPTPAVQWVQFSPYNPSSPEWIKQLNLSPNQVQRLQGISQQFRPQIQQRKQMLQQLRASLRSLMSSTASSAEIRDKFRQIEALQQDLRRIHLDSILAMREILTPDQRRRVEAYMRSRHGAGHGEGHGGFRHNGGGPASE